MGSAPHQLCPRYSGTLTPTAPTAIRLWETFTFTFYSSDYYYFANKLFKKCVVATFTSTIVYACNRLYRFLILSVGFKFEYAE